MHQSSYQAMQAFVRVHLEPFRGTTLEVLDFGSQMVDGQELSYPMLLDDPSWNYRGLDIEAGLNVDVVVDDPYAWSGVPSDSVDLVISGQAFEHVEFFWASMFEIVRVLKPGGLATVIAPSAGFEHRYPVDCWRFYRDGFSALARHVGCDIVDVFTDWDHADWADSILVARKPQWSDDDRARFRSRCRMQRALVAGVELDEVPELAADEPGPPSVLAGVQAGALTAELGAMRLARLEAEAATAHAEAAAVEARIDAEAARRTEERLQSVRSLQAYNAARQRLARVRSSAASKLRRGA